MQRRRGTRAEPPRPGPSPLRALASCSWQAPAAASHGTGCRSPTSTSRCSTARTRPSATWSTTSTRVRDRIIPVLRDRPLSVIRVHRGQEAFMQKNVPKYTPDGCARCRCWAETSKREVSYALCNDRRTLLWFANQRAVEYHPTLVAGRSARPRRPTSCSTSTRRTATRFAAGGARGPAGAPGARRRRPGGAVKTSGAKGVHVVRPDRRRASPLEDAAAATRAIAARAERARPRHRHHGLHEGGPRRQGVRRLDPRRRRDRGRRLQPAGPARRAGVVPGGLGRPRRGHARGLHRAHRAAACSATPTRGPSRCPRRSG